MESTLALAAATWAIAMALGPILQIRKMVKHGSAHNISVGYFLILLVGFVLWVAYGVSASNLALVVPNSVAALVILATIAVAARYRRLTGFSRSLGEGERRRISAYGRAAPGRATWCGADASLVGPPAACAMRASR